MANKTKKRGILEAGSFQDILFLAGIIIVSAILIIEFFPRGSTVKYADKDVFVFVTMSLPVIAAIYFIVMSFRRDIYGRAPGIRASIRKKMAVAFLFVAIIPSLSVIIISNHLISRTLSQLISGKTTESLRESVRLSRESIINQKNSILEELNTISLLIDRGVLFFDSASDIRVILEQVRIKKNSAVVYRIYDGSAHRIGAAGDTAEEILKGLDLFYNSMEFRPAPRVDRISIGSADILCGSMVKGNSLYVIYSDISGKIKERIAAFEGSLEDYERLERLKYYLTGRTGLILLIISIVLLVSSFLVSLYLSSSYSKPMLELAQASSEVARGNFGIRLERNSGDELALLYQSFNRMIVDLESNQKLSYQKQRLEAWREMARRLVHEIKNPLTPIRLSAERIRNRFLERHPDIEKIVLTGTETIIEEVEVLMKILSEFTKFARLPEMKKEEIDINSIIESCVEMFRGHEGVEFHVELDKTAGNISVDKVLIRLVIINILQNALEALGDSGQVRVSSKMSGADEAGRFIIAISDSGPGIKPELLEKIFEPGFSTKHSGSGLGLAIVEKIIIEHGGTINCKSEPGNGAEFIMEIPAV